MLGIMGNIDQQVSDKADSMRMQGKTSTVSKDLLDVMATQKIAAEKDAALKQLQMAQQQNPNTIKDQLEQKVMGMTQNEMTAQTAGILANNAQKQQMQQRNPQSTPMMGKNPSLAMNRGAPQGGIAGARPPMGGAPRPNPMGGAPRPPMGGLAAMGGAPRPMMASGGIVGFQQGGSMPDAAKEYQASKGGFMVQALTEALKRRGLTREQFEALPSAEKQAIRAEVPQIMQELKQGRDNYKSPVERLRDATSPEALTEKREIARKQLMKKNNPALFAEQYPDEVKPNAADVDTSALNLQQVGQKVEDMGGLGVLRPGAVPQAGPTATPTATTGAPVDPTKQALGAINTQSSFDPTKASGTRVSDAMGAGIMGDIKSAAGEDLYAKDGKVDRIKSAADTRYGVGDTPEELKGGIFAAMKAAQDPLKKEQERQISPEVQRAQRLLDARAGASGLGRRQAASSRAANEQKLEVKKDGVQQFKDRLDARLGAIAKSDEAAANSIKNAVDFKIAAMNSLANINSQDAALLLKEVDAMLKQDQAKISADLKKVEIMESAALRVQLAEMEDRQYMLNLLNKLSDVREKYRAEKSEQYQLELDRLDPVADKDRIAQIEGYIDVYAGGIGSGQEKVIMQRLRELGVDIVSDDLDSDSDEFDFSTSVLTDSADDASILTNALNRQ